MKYSKYEWIFPSHSFSKSFAAQPRLRTDHRTCFFPAVMGGTVIFQDSVSPADVARAIRREKVSVLVAVPRMLESLRNKVERDYADSGRAD